MALLGWLALQWMATHLLFCLLDGRWEFDDATNLTTPQGYTQVVSGQRGTH